MSLFAVDWTQNKVGLIRSTNDELDLSDDDTVVRRADLGGIPFEFSYLYSDELFLVTIELHEDFYDYDDDGWLNEDYDGDAKLLEAWNALYGALRAELGEPEQSGERAHGSYTPNDFEYWARKSSTRVRWAAFRSGGTVAICELSGGEAGLVSLRGELVPATEFA